MSQNSPSLIRTGGDADLAFAVVVLASYFATFSSLQSASPLKIVVLIALGTAYLAAGIYGYAYCVRKKATELSIAYFVVQILLGGLIVYLGKGAGFNALVLMPLAGHAVILLPRRTGYVALFIITFSYVAAVYAFSGSVATVWQGLPIFVAGLIFIVVFTQMALNEEASRREVERLLNELTAVNQRLREYAIQAEDLATVKERNRLAREIHDGLGHYLTTIFMQIQAVRAVIDNDKGRADSILAKAQNLTHEALADVRQSVAALRSPIDNHELLTEMIGGLLEGARNAGIEPELIVTGDEPELNPQTRWTLYRAAQEGISNTCKHAMASHLWIKLDFSQDACVQLDVEDNGIGPGDYKEGFGIMGLKERVSSVGGELQIGSSSSGGFEFNIKVPA
ncbi:MAG TPA: sensor histidine kinase [Bellilinea sp.]|nr:sensor histidine kinase [Bellilinea sp.]